MLKKPDNIKSKKNYRIFSDNYNDAKSSVNIDNIFGQRILAYRHGVRDYKFPRKEKILPICS
jgi:hypothetical protein